MYYIDVLDDVGLLGSDDHLGTPVVTVVGTMTTVLNDPSTFVITFVIWMLFMNIWIGMFGWKPSPLIASGEPGSTLVSSS